MSEAYEGRQIVGIDLHRRRSVLVRMTETGERLETVRISNDPDYLREVMARAGEAPEVVLEACYGWYWAADTLAELGATVHLAHPLGVKMFSYRRVKNDERDAADLADLLRMGRLPEAWIAPPATRELRGWVRHRAKLVGLRSSLKCQVHGDPRRRRGAGADERPVRRGRAAAARLRGAGGRVAVPDRLAAAVDHRAGLRDRAVRQAGRRPAAHPPRLPGHPGHPRGRAGAGRGVRRRDRRHHPLPRARSSWPRWAGLTPKHHESDTTVHRGRITKQGSRLVRWAAVEAVQRLPAHTRIGQVRDRVAARRGRNIGVVAAARELTELVFYGLRDHHIRALPAPPPSTGGVSSLRAAVGAGRGSHDPRHAAWSSPLD